MKLESTQLADLCVLRDQEIGDIDYWEHYRPDPDVFERMAFWAEVQARATLRTEALLLKAFGAEELDEAEFEGIPKP